MLGHVLLVICLVLVSTSAERYTNDWIVVLEERGDADHVAEVHGFENIGRVSTHFLSQFIHCTGVVTLCTLFV